MRGEWFFHSPFPFVAAAQQQFVAAAVKQFSRANSQSRTYRCFPAASQLTVLITWRSAHAYAQTQKCASTFCAVCTYAWLNCFEKSACSIGNSIVK